MGGREISCSIYRSMENNKKKITGFDILMKDLPAVNIKFGNQYGVITLDSINITLTKPSHWKNLKFLYNDLLPQAVPEELKTIPDSDSIKKGDYIK